MGSIGYRLASCYDYRGYEPDFRSYQVARDRLAALGRGLVVNSLIPDDPDRSFDLVVAFEVLEHLEDDVGALSGWVRWLVPGGHVLVSVPAHPGRFGPSDQLVGHCRRYTRENLSRLITSAGLDVVAVESWGMPFGYLLEAVRNLLARRRLDKSSDVGTSASGRIYQPPNWMGWIVETAMRPAAVLQRPFRDTDHGIGFIAVGRLGSGASV